MKNKFTFKVYDSNGKDVTTEREWYIDVQGDLYFVIEDIDSPLMEAEGFTYEVIDASYRVTNSSNISISLDTTKKGFAYCVDFVHEVPVDENVLANVTNVGAYLNKDEALDVGKELALEYNIPLYFENELVEIWKNANETLPPVNMLVKVKVANGYEAFDFVNEPIDATCPFQHYIVTAWRVATRKELNDFMRKIY